MRIRNFSFVFLFFAAMLVFYTNCGGQFSSHSVAERGKINIEYTNGSTTLFQSSSSYIVKNNHVIVDQDVVLGKASEILSKDTVKVQISNGKKLKIQSGKIFNSIKHDSAKFEDNKFYYKINESYSQKQKNEIEDQIIEFHNTMIRENINLEFIERTNESVYVEFKDRGLGCSSQYGYQPQSQMYINLASDCLSQEVIHHEIMHRLGFMHEHQRPDRDNYIIVLEDNFDFEGFDENTFSHPLPAFTAASNIARITDEYDFMSIMHYRNRAFSKNGEPVFNRKVRDPEHGLTVGGYVLSRLDLQVLREIYGTTPPNEERQLKKKVKPEIIIGTAVLVNDKIRISYRVEAGRDQVVLNNAVILATHLPAEGGFFNQVIPLGDFVESDFIDISSDVLKDGTMVFEMAAESDKFGLILSNTINKKTLNLKFVDDSDGGIRVDQSGKLPNCSSPEFDDDGDGYGWEQNRSCLVVEGDSSIGQDIDNNEQKTPEQVLDTNPEQVPDNTPEEETSQEETLEEETLQDDASEQVVKNNDSNESESMPICSSPLLDSNGDGYGWENFKSCLVDSFDNNTVILPDCKLAESDQDGDGYGWENLQSCRVVPSK